MKEMQEYEKDLASIRSMMERSVKFISLTGLSGILAGLYAIAGAVATYWFMLGNKPVGIYLFTAVVVLVLSIGSGILLSVRKAAKLNVTIWNSASKQLFVDLLIPLVAGGLFILMLVYQGYYLLVVPSTLIFYGLALINGSRNTYNEVRSLGLIEIALGLTAVLIPGYDLIFWAAGFGVMHILYGTIMHYRYDR